MMFTRVRLYKSRQKYYRCKRCSAVFRSEEHVCPKCKQEGYHLLVMEPVVVSR